MSRNYLQRFSVYRGHHEPNGDPDESTVGVPSWTTSIAAADVYARNPSVEGMTAENPIVSHRTYNTEMPAVFDEEEIDVGYELGELMGFEPDEISYVAEKYGAFANVWELANDPVVRNMYAKAGADAMIYPETLGPEPRFDDGRMPDKKITTFRSLGADYGDETQQEYVGPSFTGEKVDVAGKWQGAMIDTVAEALAPKAPKGIDPTRFQEATKNLLPSEKMLFVSKQGAENFDKLLTELPSVEQFGAAALEGLAKRGWYTQSAKALKGCFWS